MIKDWKSKITGVLWETGFARKVYFYRNIWRKVTYVPVHVLTEHQMCVQWVDQFNFHLAAERGRPRQIKSLTFKASGCCSQTGMILDPSHVNSGVFISQKNVLFFQLSSVKWSSFWISLSQIFGVFMCILSWIIILPPVLSQPETWQVVTVQRRVIHS